jgi:hypothetical protein
MKIPFMVKVAGIAVIAALLWVLGRHLFERFGHVDVPVLPPAFVNDSAQILQAQLRSARGELRALKDAAKKSKGDLIAGFEITLQPETVYVARAARETEAQPDGTRVVSVRDTTQGVQVSIDAVAPPTGPISVGYNLILPEINPQVGFMRKGEDYYAIVSVAGRTFTQEHAFFRKPTTRRVGVVVGGQVLTTGEQRLMGTGFAGLSFRLSEKAQMTTALTTGNNVMVQGHFKVW